MTKKNLIKLTDNQIAIKAIYDKKPSNIYDANLKPNPKAVKKARVTLSPVAWKFYENITTLFSNHAVAVTTVTELMNELGMTYEQFNTALGELVAKKYMAFFPITTATDIYEGYTFRFHDDNSLVAVCPITRAATIEELKKPFFYTGEATWKETF